MENQDIMTVYSHRAKVEEMDLLKIQSVTYLLVVNERGMTTHCGEYNDNDFETLISKQQKNQQSEKIVEEDNPLDNLNLIIEEDVGGLIQVAKDWDYQPQFQISFKQNHDINLFTKPIVKLAYRQSDEKLFENVIACFKKVAIVIKTIIQIIKIPEGKTCASCNSELKLPYYFFYFSNTFRCIECVHKINTQTNNLLERYSVNQTGLLVFKENTSIDKKRLGNNIQPKNNNQAKDSKFICNGCGSYIDSITPRYICTGCRREPNIERSYVDFCHDCVQALTGNNEEKKKSVMEIVDDEHQEWHALLRVNFAVEGYYNY